MTTQKQRRPNVPPFIFGGVLEEGAYPLARRLLRSWMIESHEPSVFLKKNVFCFFWKKHVFFWKKTLLKKNKGQNGFFSKPPVFKVNIHNLSQFVNHTVTLVQNKNNNERISLKWGLCGQCLKKKRIFFKCFILVKNFFVSRFGLSFQFFFQEFFKCVYFTFENCLSLIMASGSQFY